MTENRFNESVLTGNNNLSLNKRTKRKPWPKDCAWPEPLAYGEGQAWDELPDPDAMNDRMNLLKINYVPLDKDPAVAVREITGYEFINENLLRQAFTRRAFAMEYGLPGCNEELEFLGDTVLNMVVTREILHRLAQVNEYRTAAPFEVRFQEGGLTEKAGREITIDKSVSRREMLAEGVLTKIRSQFVSKEHLARRAALLELDKLILYGTGEEPTESAREDMMEALIGAVTVDCNWDWDVIAGIVDRLVCVQVDKPDLFLKASYYEIFNAWHQRHFGTMPDYELHGFRERFDCALRFRVPANDNGIAERQRVDVYSSTRSEAREQAAWDAYRFVRNNGLWINLKDSGITPDRDNSINQLQELYQKKYLEQLPEYEFEEQEHDEWYCMCRCCGVCGTGQAGSKIKAKKAAAYMALGLLFSSARMRE